MLNKIRCDTASRWRFVNISTRSTRKLERNISKIENVPFKLLPLLRDTEWRGIVDSPPKLAENVAYWKI